MCFVLPRNSDLPEHSETCLNFPSGIYFLFYVSTFAAVDEGVVALLHRFFSLYYHTCRDVHVFILRT